MFSISLEKSLDLVLVNGKINPPVVKLLDYESFIKDKEKSNYQSSKKMKGRNVQKVKSIILKLKIDSHDLEWKVKKTKQWLISGEKVQLVIRVPYDTSNSEIKIQIAHNLFEKFSELIKEEGKPIDKLKLANKTQYTCTFSPEIKKEKRN